jgi:2'-hydroxyisoflavone reductase
LTYEQVLDTARDIAQSNANPIWVRDDFLVEHGVRPWSEIPMWLPFVLGWTSVSIDKALASGLTFRPLADTIRATLAWAQTHEQPHPAHLSREREAKLLDAWRVHST